MNLLLGLLGPLVLVAIVVYFFVNKDDSTSQRRRTNRRPDGPSETRTDPRIKKLLDEQREIQNFMNENPDQIDQARAKLEAFRAKVRNVPIFRKSIQNTLRQLKEMEARHEARRRDKMKSELPAVNVVLNPGFEESDGEQPMSWTIQGTGCKWESAGEEGGKCLSASSIRDRDTGQLQAASWLGEAFPIDPHNYYKVTFKLKTDQWRAGNKALVAIGTYCQQTFEPNPSWKEQAFQFMSPNPPEGGMGGVGTSLSDPKRVPIRLSVTGSAGKVFFDELRIVKVKPWNKKKQGSDLELGAGETISKNGYQFSMRMNSPTTNYSRCLRDFNAPFSPTGWQLGYDRYVIYVHQIEKLEQMRAFINVTTEQYARDAKFKIEISKDSAEWQTLHTQDSPGGKSFMLSSKDEIYPTDALYIKFSADKPCTLSYYSYRAHLEHKEDPKLRVSLTGSTEFIE